MLWLALRFASLPLEVFTRAAHGSAALAVRDTDGDIIACNEAARASGVVRGMPAAAALALSGALNVVPRDAAAEAAALNRVAAWAIQFTPAVSLAAPCEVLLEIAGSLGLFGGLNALWNDIARGVRGLGLTASIACAPTPLAAQWFARAGLAVRLHHADALRASLSDLPLEAMQPEAEALALLKNVGARTVGDCLALPRDGLARRLGPRLLDGLDRALGAAPDPRVFFTPPTAFTAAQPLPAPAHEAEMLVFAARRLVNELCGFLAATGNGVQRLAFTFSHHAHAPTRIAISLVAATRDPDHLTNVLREKLERTTLPCPATALALASELLLPVASRNLTFLPAACEQEEAAAQLIERLRARLGDQAVAGLKRASEHRPERAWTKCEPGASDRLAACVAGRPLWLLPQPRALTGIGDAPCYDGRLTLLAGPERIESGWWDGGDVMRDYFVAANASEALLWIYRERNAHGGWYLHGFFA